MKREMVTIDGNEAAAYVAHKTNEVIAIYPITPSSPMGEWADEWSAKNQTNIWGTIPLVVEMQAEGGAGHTMPHSSWWEVGEPSVGREGAPTPLPTSVATE